MRECNIEGGEVIHRSFQDGGPPGFSSTTSEGEWIFRQVEPGRVGGAEEEILLFLRKKFDFNHLEPVLGGVLFTQCGDTPLIMAKRKFSHILHESESEVGDSPVDS